MLNDCLPDLTVLRRRSDYPPTSLGKKTVPFHQARCRGHAGGAVAAALAGMALADAAGASWPPRAFFAQYREWNGWPPARSVTVPRWLAHSLYRLGDVAGALGWRPPVRSNAAREIARGAVGDPGPWMSVTGIRRPAARERRKAPASQFKSGAKIALLA